MGVDRFHQPFVFERAVLVVPVVGDLADLVDESSIGRVDGSQQGHAFQGMASKPGIGTEEAWVATVTWAGWRVGATSSRAVGRAGR